MSATTTHTNENTRDVQVGNLYTAPLKQSLIHFKFNFLSLFSKPGVSLIGTHGYYCFCSVYSEEC